MTETETISSIAGVLIIIVAAAMMHCFRKRQATGPEPKPPDTADSLQPDDSQCEQLRKRNELYLLGEKIETLYTLDLPPDAMRRSVFEQLGRFSRISTVWAGLKSKDGTVKPVFISDDTELGFLTEEYGVRYIADGSEARNPSEYAFTFGEGHLYERAVEAPMSKECQRRLRYSMLESVITIPLFYPQSERPDGVLSLFTNTPYTEDDGIFAFLTELMRRFMIHTSRYDTYYSAMQRFGALEASETFYKYLFGALPVRVYWKNSDMVYLGCNALFAKDAHQNDPKSIVGKSDHDLIWSEEASELETRDRKVIREGKELVNRLERQGNMWRLSNKAPLRDTDGNITGMIAAYIDYSLLYRAQNYHEENEQRFRNLLDQMPTIAIQGFDADRRINYWNKQSEKLYGYTAGDAKGKKIDELMMPEAQRNRFIAGIANWLHHNDIILPEEHSVLARDGRSIPIHSSRILLDRQTESPQFYSVDIDLTLQKDAEAKLKLLADYDALTMLPNRRHLNHHLKALIVKSRREESSFAIFFIDLDNFKYINDTFGHQFGDELLVQASGRLKDVLRKYDFIARFGGDEFIVTLEFGDDAFSTSHIAQKMLHVLQQGFTVRGQELFVGASIGISLFPDNSGSVDMLLKQADTAMYKAKKSGKNQFAYYNEELTAEIENQLMMEGALRQIFQEDKLMFFYQPQVDLDSREIISCEALVRWYDDASGEYIPPETFLPIVEKAHLMNALTRKAFENALALLTQWRELDLRLIRIDINMPSELLNSEEIFHFVKGLLIRHQIDARYIGIEITETQLIDLHTQSAQNVLKSFNALGIHISIDDFGTGYSSLSYLSRLTVNTVKIDKSFVEDHHNRHNQALIRSIIAMAHALEYEVVAEGVETAEQAEMLTDYRCDKVQGNYFFLPLRSETMTQNLISEKKGSPGTATDNKSD